MNHKEKFQQRIEVFKMAAWRGLAVRKCGHQFQVRTARLGTLYQSHDIMEVKDWLSLHPKGCLYSDLDNKYVDDRLCPVKYGRVIQM